MLNANSEHSVPHQHGRLNLLFAFLLGAIVQHFVHRWLSSAAQPVVTSKSPLPEKQKGISQAASTSGGIHPSVRQAVDPLPADSVRAGVDRAVNENAVEEAALSRQPADSEFLRGLGMSEAAIDQYNSNRVTLHRMAMRAGSPMQELVVQRAALKSELEKILGSALYSKYRSYEEAKPARRELELIREFAATNSRDAIPSDVFPQIVEAIRTLNVPTTTSWDGPFDPVPTPLAGAEMIAPAIQDWIDKSQRAYSALPELLRQQGLSNKDIETVLQYYRSRITRFETMRSDLTAPQPSPEARRAEALKRMRDGR